MVDSFGLEEVCFECGEIGEGEVERINHEGVEILLDLTQGSS